jgi:hypothetical protein
MRLKILVVLVGLTLAFGILFISLFRAASVRYGFADSDAYISTQTSEDNSKVNYRLPYQGRVLPDSPIWPLKAARDAVWLYVTPNSMRKAELKLLFADKRLVMAKILFENGKTETAFSTLTKAEKYLEEAFNQENENRNAGMDTSQLLERLALASLKHYEVTENLIPLLPDEVKPSVKQNQDHAKKTYENARNALLEKGMPAPDNPFTW